MSITTPAGQPANCRRCHGELSFQDGDTCPECRDLEDVLAFLGGATDSNAGRIEFDGGDRTICFAREGEAPSSLHEGPVVGWIEDTGDTTGESVTGRDEHPTLAAALWNMYGPCEGDPIPAPLAPVERIVRHARASWPRRHRAPGAGPLSPRFDRDVTGECEHCHDALSESRRDVLCAPCRAGMDRARAVGLEAYHTGGGCMALHRAEANRRYVLVTGEDYNIPHKLNEGPVFVGRYDEDAEHSEPETFHEYPTYAEALAVLAGPPEEGARVRIREAVERYPHFLIDTPEAGRVVSVDRHQIAVRLDRHFPALDEWDNEVHVYAEDDEGGNVARAFWRTFQRVGGREPVGPEERAATVRALLRALSEAEKIARELADRDESCGVLASNVVASIREAAGRAGCLR